jgi:uncharacterized membrane protein YgaE (UPF0421/DUF939 family)
MASKSNHAGLGIALGAALGVVAGVVAGHIAIWLGVGVAIGMVLGATLRGTEGNCPQCAAVHRQHQAKVEEAKNLELTAKS